MKIRKKWTKEEIDILKKLYQTASKEIIQEAIPNHAWESIRVQANKLGLYRCRSKIDYFYNYVNKDSDVFGENNTYPTECWLWTGCKDKGGYGLFQGYGKLVRAHRFSYEINKTEIPSGLQIDHLCRRIDCVNPEHLEVVSARENTLRGNTITAANAKREECKWGHLLTEDNILISQLPSRVCRTCKREREKGRVRVHKKCKNGHEYTEANTIRKGKRRYCKTCMNMRK